MMPSEQWQVEKEKQERKLWRLVVALVIFGSIQFVGALNGLRLLIREWYDPPHVLCPTNRVDGHANNDPAGFARCAPDCCSNARPGASVSKTS